MKDLPKRIKKILLLLLRRPTPVRKCQMQRFSKSRQVSLGCQAGRAALSEKVETLYQQVSEFFRANLLTALFPALELWFVFVCVCVCVFKIGEDWSLIRNQTNTGKSQLNGHFFFFSSRKRLCTSFNFQVLHAFCWFHVHGGSQISKAFKGQHTSSWFQLGWPAWMSHTCQYL